LVQKDDQKTSAIMKSRVVWRGTFSIGVFDLWSEVFVLSLAILDLAFTAKRTKTKAQRPKTEDHLIKMQNFRDLLESDRAYIFDGAMGTMLYSKGIYINRSYDELNLVAADRVREVHAE